MTREERLLFCKKCLNRKFDAQKGIICGLTAEVAAFEDKCPDFKLDESVKESPAADEPYAASELKSKITADVYEKLRLEQSLPRAILFGVVATLVGALLWAVITVATGYQIGYMAVAVGALVGFTIRYFGKGVDNIFGIWGAGLSLIGCILGNIFSIVGIVATEYNLGYFEVLSALDFNIVFELLAETFSIMDVLFYGIALYEGYKFSFRRITENDLASLKANGL